MSAQILPFFPQSPSAVPVEVKRLHPSEAMQRMGPHGHTFFELLFITAGQGEVQIAGKPSAVERGSVYVIPPGVSHDIRGLDEAKGWALLFLPDSIDNTVSTGLGLLHDKPAGLVFDLYRQPFQYLGDPLRVDGAELCRLEELVGRMASELETRPRGYELSVQAALQLLLVTLARKLPAERIAAEEESRTPRERDLVGAIFRDIDENFRSANSLAAAGKRLGLSPGHLTTQLRRLTGRTYFSWVIERRMIEARRLLASSTMTIAQIAAELGYAEIESFARRFRAYHGMAPAAWRNSVHRNPDQ